MKKRRNRVLLFSILAVLPAGYLLGGSGCATTSPKKTPTAANTWTNIFTSTPTSPPNTSTRTFTSTATHTPTSSNTVVPVATPTGAGFIYLATGDSGTPAATPWTDTYVGTINVGTGDLTAWNTSAAMPAGASAPGGSAWNGSLLVCGGFTDFDFGTSISTVYQGDFAAGAFSGWTSETPLPNPVGLPQVAVGDGRIYVLGGVRPQGTATVFPNVHMAAFTGGAVGTWQPTAPLPAARWGGTAFYYGGYLYVVGGGANSTGSVASTTVYVGRRVAGGGIVGWTTTTSLPVASFGHSQAVVGNYVILAGGSSSGRTAVRVAAVMAPGTLGAWSSQPTLPTGMGMIFGSLTYANGYLYAVGGLNAAGNPAATTRKATFNPLTGTVGAWTTTLSVPVALNDQVAAP